MPLPTRAPTRALTRASARRTALVAAAGVVAATVTALGTGAGPVGAAEATTTVTFRDCEVRRLPFGVDQRVADDLVWTTPLRLNHPSPIPAGSDVTTEVELGAFPGGFIPEDINNLELYFSLELENGIAGNLRFLDSGIAMGSYDASAPLTIPEVEVDTSWFSSGSYPQRPKSLFMYFTGETVGGDFIEYSFACDTQINPPSLLTVSVYDLNATPTVVASVATARQGQRIRVSGTDLLSAAPTSPPARATVVIGGIVAGTLPINEAGAFSGVVAVPPYARPGRVQVRVANGSKAASTELVVRAAAATVRATPARARKGKQVTLVGRGFKPGEKVTLRLVGGRGTGTKAFTVAPRATGSGTVSTKVTLKRAATGTWRVTAAGADSKRTGRTSFKVV